MIAEGTANYTGGYADGKIYIGDASTTMYVVDPADGYSATAGYNDMFGTCAQINDLSSGVAKTVTINGVEVQVGRPVYVGCDPSYLDYQYVWVVLDSANRGSNKFVEYEYYDGSFMSGIAFVSGEMAADGASYVETFVILFSNGKLRTCTVTYKGNTKADISVSLGDYVETGLDASKGASMTLVAENKLTIALKTAEDVLAKDKATQAEVDKAAESLDKAIKALAPPSGNNPETGDRSMLASAVAAMLFSIAALAVLVIFRKKIFRA